MPEGHAVEQMAGDDISEDHPARPRLPSIDPSDIAFIDDRKKALGFGSFGSVYRVRHGGHIRAAKVLDLCMHVLMDMGIDMRPETCVVIYVQTLERDVCVDVCAGTI